MLIEPLRQLFELDSAFATMRGIAIFDALRSRSNRSPMDFEISQQASPQSMSDDDSRREKLSAALLYAINCPISECAEIIRQVRDEAPELDPRHSRLGSAQRM